jgi:arylsulfatase
MEPFVQLRIPKLFNLRRDPFERADENSNSYYDWLIEHLFVLYPATALAAEQLQTFREFPPRQDPASFNLDNVMKAVTDAAGSGLR